MGVSVSGSDLTFTRSAGSRSPWSWWSAPSSATSTGPAGHPGDAHRRRRPVQRARPGQLAQLPALLGGRRHTRTGRAGTPAGRREAPVSLGWWTNPFADRPRRPARPSPSSWRPVDRDVAESRPAPASGKLPITVTHLRVAEDAGEAGRPGRCRRPRPQPRGPSGSASHSSSEDIGPSGGATRGASRCTVALPRRSRDDAPDGSTNSPASSTQSRTVSDQ